MNRISQLLMRVRKSKDGKTVAKNFGYLSLLEMTSHFFPLITTPYLARVIGVDGFGILAIGTAVIAYFQSFTNYGFIYTSVKEVARKRDNIDEVSRIVSTTIISKIFLLLFSLVIVLLMIAFIPFFRNHTTVILCTFLILPGHVLNTDWVFQALEDMKYITIRCIASKLLFTVLVFFVIQSKDDYLWQPILTAIGYMLPAVWGVVVLKRKFKLFLILPSMKAIFTKIRYGFDMFITVFLPTIYTNLNTLILSSFNGNTATGIYSGGTKFTSIAYSLFQLISRTTYPFFARRMDKHKYYVRVSLILALCVSFPLFLFARPIVMIFLGSEFEQTIDVLRIVAFTPVAMSLMNSYGVNYLVLKGKEKLMRNIIVFVTFIGLGLGVVGAMYYSFIGVAIASLTTQMLRAILVTYSARTLYKNEKNGK